MNLRIGEVADITGCQVVTIRYYEKIGLLGKPVRSGGNFRLYDAGDLRRLKFIRLCRENDMPLAEIKRLLTLMDNKMSEWDSVEDLLNQRIQSIDEQMDSLSRLKSLLKHLKTSSTEGDGQAHKRHQFNPAAAEFCEYCHTIKELGV
jgi:Predicted transcriptional regulators